MGDEQSAETKQNKTTTKQKQQQQQQQNPASISCLEHFPNLFVALHCQAMIPSLVKIKLSAKEIVSVE